MCSPCTHIHAHMRRDIDSRSFLQPPPPLCRAQESTRSRLNGGDPLPPPLPGNQPPTPHRPKDMRRPNTSSSSSSIFANRKPSHSTALSRPNPNRRPPKVNSNLQPLPRPLPLRLSVRVVPSMGRQELGKQSKSRRSPPPAAFHPSR